MFLQKADDYDLKKKIDLKKKKIDLKIISDYKAEDVDKMVGVEIVGDKEIKASCFDLQKLFDSFVRNNLTPFYPEDRSVGRVKEAIYKFFEKELKMWYGDVWEEIVQIVLSENSKHFINVLEETKDRYKEEVEKRESEMIKVENWNVPETLSFGSIYVKEDFKKSIMQPFYVDYGSHLEEAFNKFLDNSEVVKWWFKNGTRDATYFAIPYNNGEQKPFYVDFVVKLKDGQVGIFDPHGINLGDFIPKNDGIYEYIKNENKKGRKIFGGIVTNTGINYSGRWIYFDKPSSEFKDNDFSSWKPLEL
jgi:type III restriction enzyme